MTNEIKRAYNRGFLAGKRNAMARPKKAGDIAEIAKVAPPETEIINLTSNAMRVYRYINERLERGQTTGKTNHHAYGPAKVAQALALLEIQVKNSLIYCRQHGWLIYCSHPKGWQQGAVVPVIPLSETSY